MARAAFAVILCAAAAPAALAQDGDVVDHAGIEGGPTGVSPDAAATILAPGDRGGGGHDEPGPGAEAEAEHHRAHHPAEPPAPINWFEWHTGKNALGGELAAGQEPMAPGLLFALFNFAVFLGLLVKFAGPKLATHLRTRHDSIKEQLQEAARLRREAREKLEEYGRRIAGVDAEVDRLIGEIRAETEAEKQMILEQARHQADAMKRDAERRIESEIARARGMLEREVVAAAVAAAEKLLGERTTAADQTRMFDTFLETLAPASRPPPSSTPPPSSPPPSSPPTSVDEEWG
jgi:F-type H+-transporting ATPase subunit b